MNMLQKILWVLCGIVVCIVLILIGYAFKSDVIVTKTEYIQKPITQIEQKVTPVQQSKPISTTTTLTAINYEKKWQSVLDQIPFNVPEGSTILKGNPARIRQILDITNDGIPEALVWTASEAPGASGVSVSCEGVFYFQGDMPVHMNVLNQYNNRVEKSCFEQYSNSASSEVVTLVRGGVEKKYLLSSGKFHDNGMLMFDILQRKDVWRWNVGKGFLEKISE